MLGFSFILSRTIWNRIMVICCRTFTFFLFHRKILFIHLQRCKAIHADFIQLNLYFKQIQRLDYFIFFHFSLAVNSLYKNLNQTRLDDTIIILFIIYSDIKNAGCSACTEKNLKNAIELHKPFYSLRVLVL